jgi:hypothetical protein
MGAHAVRIELDRAELGLVWERSGLSGLPEMLAVRLRSPRPGDGTADRLCSRGLLGPRGELNPDLRHVLGVLSDAPAEYDLRIADGPGFVVRAVSTVRAGVVAMALVVGERVTLRRLPGKWIDEAAGAALVGLLPRVPPATGTSVSLPGDDVVDLMLVAMSQGRDMDERMIEGLVMRGVDPVDARMFAALTSERRIRFAVFGLTTRDAKGVRRRSERSLRVVDTQRGRATMVSRDGFLTATPVDDRELTRALAELREPALG